MSWIRIGGLLVLFLAAGCAGKPRATETPPPWAEGQGKPAASASRVPVVEAVPAPGPAAAVSEPAVVEPALPPPATGRAVPAAVKPEAPAARPEPPAGKTEAPAARPSAPVEKPAARAPAPPAAKKEAAPPPAPKPAAATLDLALLEKRLKETDAIGVFTKLTLKNQVDDLLNQFRAYYQGKAKTTLAALRQPYDQLLLKVLSLLQDSDPPLARAIVESREAIWGILSDPEKFKNL